MFLIRENVEDAEDISYLKELLREVELKRDVCLSTIQDNLNTALNASTPDVECIAKSAVRLKYLVKILERIHDKIDCIS